MKPADLTDRQKRMLLSDLPVAVLVERLGMTPREIRRQRERLREAEKAQEASEDA